MRESITDAGGGLVDPGIQVYSDRFEIFQSGLLNASGFEFGLWWNGHFFHQLIYVGFSHEEGVGEVEVIFFDTVLTSSCFLVMTMFSYAEFGYLLTVFAPMHLDYYRLKTTTRSK